MKISKRESRLAQIAMPTHSNNTHRPPLKVVKQLQRIIEWKKVYKKKLRIQDEEKKCENIDRKTEIYKDERFFIIYVFCICFFRNL